jgi:monothiol glutaredoxin
VSELQDRIKEIIETEPVALFMKGTPEFIACGNSARALEALRAVGAPVTAVDVLPDPQIRVELTAVSGWPTIPQVFIGGELIGGADITEELYESGELAKKVEERLGTAAAPAEERVIELAGGGNPFRLV